MEEVDSIILHFLRQLEIKIPDDTKSIADLSPAIIVGAVSKCLNTINPSLNAPKSLPSGLTHRIEVAAQVAAMCKDLGYKSEVGYQTLLYHNEGDLRKVFMFLIECLPTEKENPAAPAEPEDSSSILWQKIRRKITEEFETVWTPYLCKQETNGFRPASIDCTDDTGNIHSACLPNDAYIEEILEKIKSINRQPEKVNGENKLDEPQDESKALEHIEMSKVELKKLKEEAVKFKHEINQLMTEKKTLDSELIQVKNSNESLDADIQQFQGIQCLLTELNINSEEGIDQVIAKIKTDLDGLHIKSDNCSEKNLSLRAEIAILKRELSQNNSERSRRLGTLEELKATARELKEEYRSKEQSNAKLRKEYESINRSGIKRSLYTKKIMEIINNVSKQKVEIEKILGDTRQLQKEINSLNGQLDRSFTIADETLFRDAKKDDQSKKAYKLLALLHSECNTIVSLVNDTGVLAREIVELEDHIEVEKSKRTQDTLARIQQDLKQMQAEIETLMKT